ncbi:uncharacterized protein LOC105212912 [Zeugodacus cucurbitae]|uniref:uncharacterized protein LOC105212912 n=1 Tax=Zeugodacus cucurbitae TaxID=28588 RepID=UPI0005969E28|nr:uncharacterized protein LOC105212912 [Zeugodacus cucurbitae]
MKTEKDVLKAKIWTASGKCHDDKNDQALSSIKCFIECNETLSEEIQKLKLYINNLDRKLNVINKEICQMNMIQFQKSRKDLEHAKRSLHLLEDQYENQIQMECKLTALNLIDFALDQIQIGIDMFEKLDAQGKNFMYDLDKRKLEMETLQRIKTANDTMWEFHEKKFVKRKLTEIPMKEIKILNYTKASDIEHVIDKFQEQESLYYSFSNHSNEISYRITLLNNSVARLFGELQELKIGNRNALRSQNGMIEKLENMLKVKRLNNINLKRKANVQNERIKKLFEGLQLIRDQTRVDISMLAVDFVDHKEINIKDIREQMKLIENRVQSLVCAIYKMERQKNRGIFKIYLVRDLYKVIDGPTELDQVVPATQCAECAEGDARNVDDAWNVNIMPIKDVKIWVSEKVGQPELQYRLHNVNQCRLTRSRSRRQY